MLSRCFEILVFAKELVRTRWEDCRFFLKLLCILADDIVAVCKHVLTFGSWVFGEDIDDWLGGWR